MLRNYFTLYHTAMELHQHLAGGHLTEIFSEHKNEVTLAFTTLRGQHLQLLLVTHSPLFCLSTKEGEQRKTRNSASLMTELFMQPVSGVTISPSDREIQIHFTDETLLVLQLFSSDTNLFLVKKNLITDAFKHKNALVGQPYQSIHGVPGLLKVLEKLAMNKALFVAQFNNLKAESIAESVSATLPGFDRTLVQEIVTRAANNKNPEALFSAFHSIFLSCSTRSQWFRKKRTESRISPFCTTPILPGALLTPFLRGLPTTH